MSTLTHSGRGARLKQRNVPVTVDPAVVVASSSLSSDAMLVPAGRVAGDLLIAYLAGSNGLGNISSPAGYAAGNTGVGGGLASRIFSRVATGDGSDNFIWTIAAAQKIIAAFDIRTVLTTLTWASALSNVDSSGTSPAVVSVTAPSVTAPAAGVDLIFAMTYALLAEPTAVIATPAGFDLVYEGEFTNSGGTNPCQSTVAIFSRAVGAGVTGTKAVSAQASGGSDFLELVASRLVLSP